MSNPYEEISPERPIVIQHLNSHFSQLFPDLKPEIITELVEKKTPHQKEKFGSIRRFVTFFTIYEFVKDIQKELEKLKNKKNS